MKCSISPSVQGHQRGLLAVLASAAVLTAGCSNMMTTATGVSSLGQATSVTGKLHGGNQAVSGATVSLYFNGQTGIGSPATLAATTTTSSDGTGSFQFHIDTLGGHPNTGNTFSCPTSGADPLVYVISRGGNTQNDGSSSVNPAAVFLAPLGLCSTITTATFVDVSEVTTVATIAATQQFFNPTTESIGADAIFTSQNALKNSFALIPNMVNLSNGTAVASTTVNGFGNGTTGVSVVITPEQAKINQIANIISACVNTPTGGGACTTLFQNATPPIQIATSQPSAVFPSQATDVLQAAYFMLTNPTDSSNAKLQNLYNLASGAGAPYQPALSSAPSDWTIGIRYASNSTCGASNGGFFNTAAGLNIDANGNLWVASAQPSIGNLSEISPTGLPLTCVTTGGSFGGGLVDISGNIWTGVPQQNQIQRYTPSNGSTLIFPLPVSPIAVTVDGQGNVFFSSSTGNSLYEIPNGTTAPAAIPAVQISNSVGGTPARIFPDKTGAIWASSGSGFVSQVAPGVGVGALNGYITTQFNVPSPTYGVTVDGNSTVYVSSQGPSNQVTRLSGTGTNYSIVNGWPTASGFAGLNVPTAITIDGSNNSWVTNNASGANSVSEISGSTVALSPSTGFVKDAASFANGRTVVVDSSGNVWVGRDSSNAVVEIVGAGVAIYQPFSVGLQQGRFQTIP